MRKRRELEGTSISVSIRPSEDLDCLFMNGLSYPGSEPWGYWTRVKENATERLQNIFWIWIVLDCKKCFISWRCWYCFCFALFLLKKHNFISFPPPFFFLVKKKRVHLLPALFMFYKYRNLSDWSTCFEAFFYIAVKSQSGFCHLFCKVKKMRTSLIPWLEPYEQDTLWVVSWTSKRRRQDNWIKIVNTAWYDHLNHKKDKP